MGAGILMGAAITGRLGLTAPGAALAHAELVAAAGLGLVLAYLVFVWRGLRRDWEPVMGQAVSRPAGLSAPTLRFVRAGQFDTASLTAALLALAAKGAIQVEQDRKAVRLRKVASPKVPLTRAEYAFARGLMRVRSTLLINQNAGPAMAAGAAALQNGIAAEWRGYQAGRLRRRLWPLWGIALAVIAIAAPFADNLPRYALSCAVLSLALALAGHFVFRIAIASLRLWQDPMVRAAAMAFYAIAVLAALGTSWMVLSWDGFSALQGMTAGRASVLDGDAIAAIFSALVLAVPYWAQLYFCASRQTAGPLFGRIDALRNQLLGKSQGIYEISPMAKEPADKATAAVAETLWLADAIALDAVAEQPAGRLASLSGLFENPDRLSDALRALVPAPTRPADMAGRTRTAES